MGRESCLPQFWYFEQNNALATDFDSAGLLRIACVSLSLSIVVL